MSAWILLQWPCISIQADKLPENVNNLWEQYKYMAKIYTQIRLLTTLTVEKWDKFVIKQSHLRSHTLRMTVYLLRASTGYIIHVILKLNRITERNLWLLWTCRHPKVLWKNHSKRLCHYRHSQSSHPACFFHLFFNRCLKTITFTLLLLFSWVTGNLPSQLIKPKTYIYIYVYNHINIYSNHETSITNLRFTTTTLDTEQS